jgi:hypothetical protein
MTDSIMNSVPKPVIIPPSPTSHTTEATMLTGSQLGILGIKVSLHGCQPDILSIRVVIPIRDIRKSQGQGMIPLIILNIILFVVDEVPTLHEMSSQILDNWALQAHRKIRPSHSRILRTIQFVVHILGDILEVVDPSIVIVLAWENSQVDVSRVHVNGRMRVRVPAAKTHIQTAHERDLSINETQLFMVSPVEDDIVVHAVQCMQCIIPDIRQLERLQGEILDAGQDLRLDNLSTESMIRMTEDGDVGMQCLESFFGVFGTYYNG